MLVKIELTDYHIKWMQENYGKVSRKDCAQHFQVSTLDLMKVVQCNPLQIQSWHSYQH